MKDWLAEWVHQPERCPQLAAWSQEDGERVKLFFTFGDHIFTEELTWVRCEPGQVPEGVFYFENPQDYDALQTFVNGTLGPKLEEQRIAWEYGLFPVCHLRGR